MAFMGRFYRMLRIWNHGLHPGRERHCWLTNAHNFASNFDYRHEIYRLHTFVVVCLLNDSQMRLHCIPLQNYKLQIKMHIHMCVIITITQGL